MTFDGARAVIELNLILAVVSLLNALAVTACGLRWPTMATLKLRAGAARP